MCLFMCCAWPVAATKKAAVVGGLATNFCDEFCGSIQRAQNGDEPRVPDWSTPNGI